METLLFASQALADAGDASSMLGQLITQVDPTTTAVWIPGFLELIAAIAGAVSGALTACDKRLDIVGVCVLALITSLGGGLMRDMILPTNSIYMLDHPGVVIGCLLTGVVAFFFSGLLYRLNKPVAVFDIISVALFTYSGADKTLLAGFGPVACVLMGVLTGVGGGMARDTCLGRIPNIFRSGNFYAVCSMAGAIVYVTLANLHVVKWIAALACVAVVLTLRYLSLHYHLITAMPVDLTPEIVEPFKRIRSRYRIKNHPAHESDLHFTASPENTDAARQDTASPCAPNDEVCKKRRYHILVQRGEPMESWDDTPERQELERRKEQELRKDPRDR